MCGNAASRHSPRAVNISETPTWSLQPDGTEETVLLSWCRETRGGAGSFPRRVAVVLDDQRQQLSLYSR